MKIAGIICDHQLARKLHFFQNKTFQKMFNTLTPSIQSLTFRLFAGKENIVWPGLNSPVIRGKELVPRQKLPEDPHREEKLIKIRSEMGVFRPLKLSPIERGWSGAKMPGRSIGAPDTIGEGNCQMVKLKIILGNYQDRMKTELGFKINSLSFNPRTILYVSLTCGCFQKPAPPSPTFLPSPFSSSVAAKYL